MYWIALFFWFDCALCEFFCVRAIEAISFYKRQEQLTPAQNHHLAVWPRPKHLVLLFCLRAMSSCATLLEMLSAEKLYRCEKYLDVPDRDGSKPFVFSIDGTDLQASNRKGANWNWILFMTKKYGFRGDLSQQFAAFKKWLESDRWEQSKRSTRLRWWIMAFGTGSS